LETRISREKTLCCVVSDVSAESVLFVQDQAIQEVSLDESAKTLRTPGAAGQTKYHQISEHCSFKVGNASMPEQVKRPNPWRKMMIN